MLPSSITEVLMLGTMFRPVWLIRTARKRSHESRLLRNDPFCAGGPAGEATAEGGEFARAGDLVRGDLADGFAGAGDLARGDLAGDFTGAGDLARGDLALGGIEKVLRGACDATGYTNEDKSRRVL
jgi:hypothetical protein